MALILPFAAIRPDPRYTERVAALPYDVYHRAEAAEAAAKEPLSFLNIDRPETQFGPDQDMYAPEVYKMAHDLLWKEIEDGVYRRDEEPCYYLYELTMDGRSQTGIVACASIDDYLNNVIKKHENTRADRPYLPGISCQGGPAKPDRTGKKHHTGILLCFRGRYRAQGMGHL